MATLQQRRQQVESWVQFHAPWAINRQEMYLAANGRYWQGVYTHNVAPDENGDVAPDLSRSPHDQATSWADAGWTDKFPAAVTFRAAVHVYEGPSGHGWWFELQVLHAGTLYQRSWDGAGPDTHAHGWQARPLQ